MSPEARALANVLLNHHRQAIRQSREPLKDGGVHDHGWPPINSLAVNYATRMPGEGYDKAPGCSRLNWPKEVAACIEFTGYPDAVE